MQWCQVFQFHFQHFVMFGVLYFMEKLRFPVLHSRFSSHLVSSQFSIKTWRCLMAYRLQATPKPVGKLRPWNVYKIVFEKHFIVSPNLLNVVIDAARKEPRKGTGKSLQGWFFIVPSHIRLPHCRHSERNPSLHHFNSPSIGYPERSLLALLKPYHHPPLLRVHTSGQESWLR